MMRSIVTCHTYPKFTIRTCIIVVELKNKFSKRPKSF